MLEVQVGEEIDKAEVGLENKERNKIQSIRDRIQQQRESRYEKHKKDKK